MNQAGSFGLDYGAYNKSTHDCATEELPLDEMSAAAPVIRTSKPPSGFSSLTAPKPAKPDTGSSLRSLLRSSRPTSRESGSDDTRSIGSVSVEPGQYGELKGKTSTDSWEKKQARATKGLLYMNSRERLQDTERKRAAAGISKTPRSIKLELDSRSFMSETPITEETGAEDDGPAPSPGIGSMSHHMKSVSNGGIGSGRYIPTRESSLKPKKRASTSRRSSKQPAKDRADNTIKEDDEYASATDKKSDKGLKPGEKNGASSKFLEPLPSPTFAQQKAEMPKKAARSRTPEPVPVHEDPAPSPSVAQRNNRNSADAKAKKSGRLTPDPFKGRLGRGNSTRENRKSKRLSAHLSGAESDTEDHKRSSRDAAELKNARSSTEARPSSADSIDDAVEAYLCSPRLSHKIKHPQTGRVISFSEVGDSTGFAVFCCVGMGLTRYITAFYDELALTLKLRLITPDRPGVGDSEPYSDGTGTPLSWPDDVYAICQTLKITKFSILAHSAGAIYALATALRMPQHIRGRIHLLAPWIPPSQLNVIGGQQVLPPSNSIPTAQRILRNLPTPMLKIANSSFMSATSSSVTSSLPRQRRGKRKSTPAQKNADAPPLVSATAAGNENAGSYGEDYPKPANGAQNQGMSEANIKRCNKEQAILAAAAMSAESKERQVTYDTRLTHAIWDLATSGANPAVDLLVCLERRHTIGFRYVDITRAVVIHHGSKDTRVPVDNVRWLGKMMRRCEVRVLEGEGHGLMASAQVMGGVLMEIAGEWEDWRKVVERKGGVDGREAGRRVRESRSVGAFRNKD